MGEDTRAEAERALLVAAEIGRRGADGWSVAESLDELERLATTAGIDVVGRAHQHLERVHAATYIGDGKVDEIAGLRDGLQYTLVVFDDQLSPAQLRNLEERLQVKVLDRTALILDIFAQHASTREGGLQVELAQYEYRLPRLTRAWTHLARQAGGSSGRGGAGGVGVRGPGETQLEVDRREIAHRITQLKRDLESVRRQRAERRRQRRSGQVPVVAIVGYTNAGKSTLLNAITGANVLVENKLFATLDPTTRRVVLPGGKEVLFSDTVGFIHKLPTMLVAAFRATLEEVNEADLLLRVLDASQPNASKQAQIVNEVLDGLGAGDTPTITVLNKSDLVAEPSALQSCLTEFPGAIAISAQMGEGVPELLCRVEAVLAEGWEDVEVQLPYAKSDLVALFHQHGLVLSERHLQKGTVIVGRLPRWLVSRFREYER